jgi:DNA-binding NarL/FixJ family response regulator
LLAERFGSVMMRTAKNGKQAIEIIEIEKIDLVITDWDMPEIGGYEIARLSCSKNIKTIVLTSHTDIAYLLEMESLGVNGILLKKMDNNDIMEKIIDIWEGENYMHPEIMELLDNLLVSVDLSLRFTKREIELLRLQKAGLTQKKIGEKMFIDVKTVEKHKKNIIMKMGVENIMQAVLKAMELGLIRK